MSERSSSACSCARCGHDAKPSRRPRSAAQHGPGEVAGVTAVLERHRAIDEGGPVAAGALDVATGTAREVVDVLGQLQSQGVEIDDVDVGEAARRAAAAIGDPEQVGRVGRQPADAFLDGEHTLVANPVHQEERRLAGVHDLPDVGAGIGQAHHHAGSEHLLDGVETLVQEGVVEETRPSVSSEQFDERLDGADAAPGGDGGERVLGIGA